LADGTACFRLKGNTDDYFNAQGVLIQTAAPQLIDFTGLLKKGEIQTTFKLDSIEVGGNKVFLDNSNTNFNFRVKLKSPIQDTIQSLMIFTKRNF
jgi:hypothetical protein